MLRSIATIGLLCVAHAAWASDQPRYEAPPAWVKPFDVPKPAAAAGLNAAVPAHVEYVLRGDAGIQYKERLADMSPDEADSYLRDYWRQEYDWIDIAKVDAVYDEQTGEEHVSMDGSANMRWKGDGGALGQHYEADGVVLGWKADYGRESGPARDMSDLTIYLRAPVAAGKGGNTETASAKMPAGCSPDLAPIHADNGTTETQFAGQGTKP